MLFLCFCRDPKCLNLDNILGFILNVPSDYKLGFVLLPLRRRHWVTIRQVHGTYYNLDSKLEFPQLIGRVSDFWQLAQFTDCSYSVLNIYLSWNKFPGNTYLQASECPTLYFIALKEDLQENGSMNILWSLIIILHLMNRNCYINFQFFMVCIARMVVFPILRSSSVISFFLYWELAVTDNPFRVHKSWELWKKCDIKCTRFLSERWKVEVDKLYSCGQWY